jgi:aspartate/methionine/tyrosine aminotransferase
VPEPSSHAPEPSSHARRELIADRAVAVVRGRFYGASTDAFVRVGVGTESEARVEAALGRIRETLR